MEDSVLTQPEEEKVYQTESPLLRDAEESKIVNPSPGLPRAMADREQEQSSLLQPLMLPQEEVPLRGFNHQIRVNQALGR